MTSQQHTYVIQPSRLVGTVTVSGAKNSALKLLTASLLTNETITIENYPASLLDTQIHVEMLTLLGKTCSLTNNTIAITETANIKSVLEWHDRSIRNTLLMLGALVARTGQGAVPLPGGCDIGDRKYDLHEMVLRSMGAEVWTEHNMLYATSSGRLKGADIHLAIRSTGATENAVLCGCLAEGITRVWNPHIRPEIIDLIACLRKMGAKIQIYGQQCIEIEGVEQLTGAQHSVIPDNMEAITWLIGSVITNGDVEVVGFPYNHLEIPLIYLRESGAKFYRGEDRLIVRGGCCYPVDISTGPYPGINSDMQPMFAVYGLCAKGESRIIDLRFPGRYLYAEEMKKMGGVFSIKGNMLFIFGGNPLKGTRVKATDLRAGAALALAGLVAEGETVIEDAWQIDRGYNEFKTKMRSLSAGIFSDEEK